VEKETKPELSVMISNARERVRRLSKQLAETRSNPSDHTDEKSIAERTAKYFSNTSELLAEYAEAQAELFSLEKLSS
jgi:hypothetical protein